MVEQTDSTRKSNAVTTGLRFNECNEVYQDDGSDAESEALCYGTIFNASQRFRAMRHARRDNRTSRGRRHREGWMRSTNKHPVKACGKALG
jgi:hypothetical protein